MKLEMLPFCDDAQLIFQQCHFFFRKTLQHFFIDFIYDFGYGFLQCFSFLCRYYTHFPSVIPIDYTVNKPFFSAFYPVHQKWWKFPDKESQKSALVLRIHAAKDNSAPHTEKVLHHIPITFRSDTETQNAVQL